VGVRVQWDWAGACCVGLGPAQQVAVTVGASNQFFLYFLNSEVIIFADVKYFSFLFKYCYTCLLPQKIRKMRNLKLQNHKILIY
jgi:hypothetical protein